MRSLLMSLMLAAAPAAAQAPSASQPAAKKPPAAKKAESPAKKGAKKEATAKAPDAGTPPEPPKPFRWDVPGLLSWVDSPGQQISDGVPMHIQLARTSMKLDAAIQHMADHFRKSGLFISSAPWANASPVTEPMLTALDTRKLTAYTVIFQENPDKTVTLILGTSDVSKYTPQTGVQLGWAPVMPGAQQVTRSDLEGAQMAMFAVPTSAEKVMEYYRLELGHSGFVEDPKQPGVFQRGTEQITVITQKEDETQMVALKRRLGVEPP